MQLSMAMYKWRYKQSKKLQLTLLAVSFLCCVRCCNKCLFAVRQQKIGVIFVIPFLLCVNQRGFFKQINIENLLLRNSLPKYRDFFCFKCLSESIKIFLDIFYAQMVYSLMHIKMHRILIFKNFNLVTSVPSLIFLARLTIIRFILISTEIHEMYH